MLTGMMLCRFVEVMLGLEVVAVCYVCMMSSLFMIARFMVLCGFLAMGGGVAVMFSSLLMMVSAFMLSHIDLSVAFGEGIAWVLTCVISVSWEYS